MNIRPYIKPGDLSIAITAKDWNSRSQIIETRAKASFVGGFQMTAGRSLSIPSEVVIWAKLSGSASPYSFTQQFRLANGSWQIGSLSGTSNAYEVNHVSGLNGLIVALYPGYADQDWRFQIVEDGGPPPPPPPPPLPCQVNVNVVDCSGHPASGVNVVLSNSGGTVASGATDGSGNYTWTGTNCPSRADFSSDCATHSEILTYTTISHVNTASVSLMSGSGQWTVVVNDYDSGTEISSTTTKVCFLGPPRSPDSTGRIPLIFNDVPSYELDTLSVGGYWPICDKYFNLYCGDDLTFTLTACSKSNWNLSACEPCGTDWDGNRVGAIPHKLYVTFNGPQAIFGSDAGATIELDWDGKWNGDPLNPTIAFIGGGSISYNTCNYVANRPANGTYKYCSWYDEFTGTSLKKIFSDSASVVFKFNNPFFTVGGAFQYSGCYCLTSLNYTNHYPACPRGPYIPSDPEPTPANCASPCPVSCPVYGLPPYYPLIGWHIAYPQSVTWGGVEYGVCGLFDMNLSGIQQSIACQCEQFTAPVNIDAISDHGGYNGFYAECNDYGSITVQSASATLTE